MRLFCDDCGAIDYVLVDGYSIGDRLLEGVMFMVEDKDGKPHTLGVTERDEDYFDQFNQAKFISDMDALCESEDVATCPKCGNDVEIWGGTKISKPLKQVEMIRGIDLLTKMRRASK